MYMCMLCVCMCVLSALGEEFEVMQRHDQICIRKYDSSCTGWRGGVS